MTGINMFKSIGLVALLVAVGVATVVDVRGNHGQDGTHVYEADKTFLLKQKSILHLLRHIHQKSMINEHLDICRNYNIEDHVDKYTDINVVKDFVRNFKNGNSLRRGQVFNVLNEEHIQQAIKLFDLLYFARDWDTFYKTAVWARNNVNEGMFVYCLTVAVLHREDCRGLVLPPPYEICPHLYVKNDVLQRAYETKMRGNYKLDTTGKNRLIIQDWNTQWWRRQENHKINLENTIRYFTEDVGLNTYNMLYHLECPHWMKSDRYNIRCDRRGELFWYTRKQLLNRYNIERLVNNLDSFENFNYDKPHIVGYAPNLRHSNGQDMVVRTDDLKLRTIDIKNLELVRDFDRRIRDAIDMGYIYDKDGKLVNIRGENGIDILGRLIEETADNLNPRYYGTLYNHCLNLIGHLVDPLHKHDVADSALQHFSTMLRDPMYYRLIGRLDSLFRRYKSHLTKYTKDDLIFPGVKIQNLSVDKLITYFDKFNFDITNGVDVKTFDEDDKLEINAEQWRLNHKEFTLRMDINSDKDTITTVRVFLAPKQTRDGREITVNERQKLMIEVDRFAYKLKKGTNRIERKNREMKSNVGDLLGFRSLARRVEDALLGKQSFVVDENNRICGFPDRLLLPKGTKGGMLYTMVVILTPSDVKGTNHDNVDIDSYNRILSCGLNRNLVNTDKYPMGFPFDREIRRVDINNENCYNKCTISSRANNIFLGKHIVRGVENHHADDSNESMEGVRRVQDHRERSFDRFGRDSGSYEHHNRDHSHEHHVDKSDERRDNRGLNIDRDLDLECYDLCNRSKGFNNVVPNMIEKEVVIYHKKYEQDMNRSI